MARTVASRENSVNYSLRGCIKGSGGSHCTEPRKLAWTTRCAAVSKEAVARTAPSRENWRGLLAVWRYAAVSKEAVARTAPSCETSVS